VKVGDLVKDKLWGELGIVVCVPPKPSMIEVFWSGENPRRQKHLLGDLEELETVLNGTDELKAALEVSYNTNLDPQEAAADIILTVVEEFLSAKLGMPIELRY